LKAKDIMTPEPFVVTPTELVSHAAQIMRDREIGLIPVVADKESMRLVGVITDRDIAVRHVAGGHAGDCAVSAHMTSKDLETVDEGVDAASVLAAMRRREIRRVVVVNRDGRVGGVIAQADIAIEDGIPKKEVGETVKAISEPAGRR